MVLRHQVILIDDEDWREFQRISPDNPAAYATAALGLEGDRLRREAASTGDASGARSAAATRDAGRRAGVRRWGL